MSFSVIGLTADDTDRYRAIRLAALRDHPDAFASSFEAASEKPDAYFREALENLTFFGAVTGDGALGGIVAFSRSEGDKEQHRGWLYQMYVRPEWRGFGLALGLIEALVEHAHGQVIQVHLSVAAHNHTAIGLYRKAGFEIYGTDPRFLQVDGRYIDEHLMVRFLDKEDS